MDLRIRSCKTEDFDSIFPLLKQLWPDLSLDRRKLRRIYEKGLGSDRQKFIVGVIDENIVGFCSLTIKNNLWQMGNLGHIDELVVDEKYRGRGIGKKLIEKITEIAKKNKCKRVELDSAFHRKEAHKFYENIGYQNRAYLFSKRLEN